MYFKVIVEFIKYISAFSYYRSKEIAPSYQSVDII